MSDSNNAKKVAVKVSVVGMIGNILLTIFKFIAGIVAHSGAMTSDAVHSASDVFGGLIVIIGVRFSSKESDSDHPYGHERFECVAALMLSVALFLTGGTIGVSALQKILSGEYRELEIKGQLALIAAITSIVVKEAMFWYTRINAKRIDSTALAAEAWHHRSDALSSVGALIGIIFNAILPLEEKEYKGANKAYVTEGEGVISNQPKRMDTKRKNAKKSESRKR